MTWKVWAAIVALVAISGAGIARYRIGQDKPSVRYTTASVQRGSISARVSATGTLSALVTVQVGSQISGRIQELFVDFNSKVKKGQVLARIDPELFRATVAQARANHAAALGSLSKAKANAENTKRRHARYQMLSQQNLIAEADLDQTAAEAASAEADLEAAKGNVEQTVAARRQADVNLAYATILSPVDGVVISRNVDVGQTVAASLQAPTLFTIAGDLTKMQVDTSVAEADVGKLAQGMPSSFTVDAYPSIVFRALVREVRNAPQTVQNVVTYDAVLDVDNSELRLKPGMTAHVNFVYAERQAVIKVPNAALRFRPTDASEPEGRARKKRGKSENTEPEPAAERSAVWVLRGKVPERVVVRVGLSDGTTSEIVEGPLGEGDRVVVDAPEGAGSESKPAPARLF
jgi:HlyD family secretion protein